MPTWTDAGGWNTVDAGTSSLSKSAIFGIMLTGSSSHCRYLEGGGLMDDLEKNDDVEMAIRACLAWPAWVPLAVSALAEGR